MALEPGKLSFIQRVTLILMGVLLYVVSDIFVMLRAPLDETKAGIIMTLGLGSVVVGVLGLGLGKKPDKGEGK